MNYYVYIVPEESDGELSLKRYVIHIPYFAVHNVNFLPIFLRKNKDAHYAWV